MAKELSTIFASPFFDLSGLKRAALYFDRVKIPCELSLGGGKASGLMLESVDAINFITPETVQREIDLLVREGVVEVVNLNAADAMDADHFAKSEKRFSEGTLNKFRIEVEARLGACWEQFAELQHLADGRSDSFLLIRDADPQRAHHVSNYYARLYLAADRVVNRYRLPLVTDSPVLLDIMHKPYSDGDFLKRVLGTGFQSESQGSLLATEILKVYLPELDDVPFEAVLAARGKLVDELGRFRTEVAALATSIRATPLSDEGVREARILLESTVARAVDDLRAKIRSSREKNVVRAFKNIQSPKAYIPFLGTVFADLSIVAAGFAAIGLAAAGTVIEAAFDSREVMRGNRLAFLLAAPKVLWKRKTARKSSRVRVAARVGEDALVIVRNSTGFNIIQMVEAGEFLHLVDTDLAGAERYVERALRKSLRAGK